MSKRIKTIKDLGKIAGAELAAKKGKAKTAKAIDPTLPQLEKHLGYINQYIDPRNNVDSRLPKVGHYLVTRNRRDQPVTSEWDELLDGKPTGKIVVGSRFIDGKYTSIYKGEEPFEPDPKNFDRWFQKQFGDKLAIDKYNERVDEKGTFAENLGKPAGKKYEVYVLEFDWDHGYEKEECKSKKHALERKFQWEETFPWAKFSNFKIYKEVRYRNPIK